MPVFPLVASRMVPPGLRRPSASAARTIDSAVRSLMLAAGLKNSSLPSTVASGNSLDRRTSGVRPTSSVGLLDTRAGTAGSSGSSRRRGPWCRVEVQTGIASHD